MYLLTVKVSSICCFRCSAVVLALWSTDLFLLSPLLIACVSSAFGCLCRLPYWLSHVLLGVLCRLPYWLSRMLIGVFLVWCYSVVLVVTVSFAFALCSLPVPVRSQCLLLRGVYRIRHTLAGLWRFSACFVTFSLHSGFSSMLFDSWVRFAIYFAVFLSTFLANSPAK